MFENSQANTFVAVSEETWNNLDKISELKIKTMHELTKKKLIFQNRSSLIAITNHYY